MDIITEQQTAKLHPLVHGMALDFGDYKDRAGYLRALSDVLKWMDAITMEDEKREMRP